MTTVPCWARVCGPLEAYADGFRAELERLGYTPLTAAVHVRLMAHLSRWLARQGKQASELSPSVVEAYFAERRAVGYVGHVSGRALRPLVGYLQRLGVVLDSVPVAPGSPVVRLLARYRHWQLTERGLTETTADLNARLVRPFLLDRLKTTDGELDLKHLQAGEVSEFVVAYGQARPRSVKRMVSALRSLLRFLHVEGITDRSLATAVPPVAGWTQTGLPKALSADQVMALLACCDEGTARGRRDRAILTLLSRLGLRAGEVAALTLDDLDWRRGEIIVRGKGGRCDRLPLPADVGERIVAYLVDGRPVATHSRAVFVRAQAPYQPLRSNTVTTVVVSAARRAGVGLVGAHRLRHSAATAMLRSGGSLIEIGQVLRHVRPLTTALYAKVDIEALRQLAQPWPGELA